MCQQKCKHLINLMNSCQFIVGKKTIEQKTMGKFPNLEISEMCHIDILCHVCCHPTSHTLFWK